MSADFGGDEFLSLLRRSRVVEDSTLDAFLAAHPDAIQPTASETAAYWVRSALITPYQAHELLKRKWQGFVLGNKYRILGFIGSGGGARVYLGEHLRLGRTAAVKVLSPETVSAPGMIERMFREARAVASLDHPNIVKVFDADMDGDSAFLVLEFVDGSSLHDVVERWGPMSLQRACHYMHQAASGLQHGFEAGWVHRDVKPDNMLLDRQGVVKILDYGLARMFTDEVDPLTRNHQHAVLMGTADYMSPEQTQDSHDVDVRADIYSLGASFRFLLTGAPPFPDGSVAQKLMWHRQRDPTPLRGLRPGISAELAAIVERMMAKRREERFQTPSDVMEALDPWVKTPIPPPPGHEMPWRSPKAACPSHSDDDVSAAPTMITMEPPREEAAGVEGASPLDEEFSSMSIDRSVLETSETVISTRPNELSNAAESLSPVESQNAVGRSAAVESLCPVETAKGAESVESSNNPGNYPGNRLGQSTTRMAVIVGLLLVAAVVVGWLWAGR